jgi:hypothetical protein
MTNSQSKWRHCVSRVKGLKAHEVETGKLQDLLLSDLNESYRREDTYARLLMYLKAQDYRLTHPDIKELRPEDEQEMKAAITKGGYLDVIKWIKRELSVISVTTGLTEDGECTETINAEAKLLQKILEEPAPRTEARLTLQELIVKYAIPTHGIRENAPEDESPADMKLPAHDPPVNLVPARYQVSPRIPVKTTSSYLRRTHKCTANLVTSEHPTLRE